MRCVRILGALALSAVLSGCLVGPNYERPSVPTPAGYRGADSTAVADSAASLADLVWWDLFRDSTLQVLIRGGLAGNYDLRAAVARVDEARALIGVARSELYPWLDASASGSYGESPVSDVPESGDQRRTILHADLGLSWELDLFGRVRREGEAAVAQFLGTEQARRGVVLSLVATVAQAYFNLRELDLELEIAYRTLETRRGTLDLFRTRFEGGVASQLEVSQAAADVALIESTIPDLQRRIAAQENLINFLLGRGPGPIARGSALGVQYLPPEVPAGLPSALLERRPDVVEAEEVLVAANAKVGAAKANFFPQLSLTGLFGFASLELQDVATSEGLIWSVGGGLLQPIFQGGRIRKNYEASLARREQAVALYLKAALNAFREVSDALVAVQRVREAREASERQVAYLREAAELARLRYEGGVSSYLEVLDADRQLFSAENTLARTQGFQLNSYVNLYRSLGGGWNADVLEAQAEPQAGQATDPSLHR
jgi:multidrug efflux system outer membrane protein